MLTIGQPSPDLNPRHVFLDATAVMARYGWGKKRRATRTSRTGTSSLRRSWSIRTAGALTSCCPGRTQRIAFSREARIARGNWTNLGDRSRSNRRACFPQPKRRLRAG